MYSFSDKKILRSLCYLNGKWEGEPETEVINPATMEVIAKVPSMGAKETDLAIHYAQKALAQWSGLTAKQRSCYLKKWYNLIVEHKEDLALLMTLEQGKPLAESRGEIDYAASFVEFYAEEAKRVTGETIPSPHADARVIVIKQPIGVVAAITPWNFPSAMITRKLCPALAVGCTIVCKPAPDTPLSAFALAELADRAGIPQGVINVITGDAKQIGEALTRSPIVRALTFTGSTAVGKLLLKQSADTVKKVSLELGGNASFIIFDDADIDKAVEGAIASKFRNAGQTCVCANRVYVHDAVYDKFVEKFTQKISQMTVGNGLQSNTIIGPLINKAAFEKVERHVKEAVAKGATIHFGGGGSDSEKGYFYKPTILTNVSKDMPFSYEETFGPVAPITRFHTEEEVISLANDTPYGLASYFYARDVGRIMRVAEQLENGIVGVNSGIISSETVPFGGIKESGLGREGSHHGIEEFVEMKYIYLGGLS